MDGHRDYVVEYHINANIAPAAEGITRLVGIMEEFQARYGASLRQSAVASDRILKAAKSLGNTFGKQMDMSKPIAQMQAFQGALVRTFSEAHKSISSLFGGDLRALSKNIDSLGKVGFMSEKSLAKMKSGVKGTGSEFKRLAFEAKNAENSLNSVKNLYERYANAVIGRGAKSKLNKSVLKTFNDEEKRQIKKFTGNSDWMTATGEKLQKDVDKFKSGVATAISTYGQKKAALEKAVSENKQGKAVASTPNTVVSNPLLMTAEEMDKKVKATRKMIQSMNKLMAENKGKPRTINYTVALRTEDAVSKLNGLKAEFEKLQSMANISVRVRGAGAAKSFNESITQIKNSVTGLKDTLAGISKAGKLKAIPLKAAFKKSDLRQSLKNMNLSVPVKVIPSFGKRADRKQSIDELKKKIPPVNIKINIANAKRKFDEFIAHIQKFRNQTINLNAVANSKYRTGRNGTSTTQPASSGVGQTTVQRSRFPNRPGAYVTQGPSARDMRRYSRPYQLVGNTSLGVQTPAFVGMAKGMVGMMGIGAAFGLVGNAINQAVEYQNTMRTVKGILKENAASTGYTPEKFNQMEKNIRRVGMDTKFTAPEVGGAARFMAMAGLSVDEINNSIRPIADVALVGDNDLETTADKLTNIQTAFKLGKNPKAMRKLADNMVTTFTRFNTDMIMTAEAMQYAAPVAAAAGLSIEDTLAMIGIMGNAGIQSSSAGTTLRMALNNIIKPNKNQAKTWKSLGISTVNSDGSPRNIIDVLSELREKVDDKKLVGVVSNLFRVTSMAGAIQITKNLSQLKATRDDMLYGRDEGISSRLSLEKQNTVKGLWAQVTSAFTEDNVQMFERFQGAVSGILLDVRNYLRTPQAAENLLKIYELIKTMIEAFGKVAGFWIGLYGRFSGLFKNVLVMQLWANQIGMLLNPIIGLFRAARMVGANGIRAIQAFAGAGAVAAGVPIAGQAAGGIGYAGATIAGSAAMGGMFRQRAFRSYNATIPFPNSPLYRGVPYRNVVPFTDPLSIMALSTTMMHAPQTTRVQSSFTESFRKWNRVPSIGNMKGVWAGTLGKVGGALGSILGVALNPITLSLAAIAAGVFAIRGIVAANKRFNESVSAASSANAAKWSAIGNQYSDRDIQEIVSRRGVAGTASISEMSRGLTGSSTMAKIAAKKLRQLDSTKGLLYSDDHYEWLWGDKTRNKFLETYVNPVSNDSVLSGLLAPYMGINMNSIDQVKRLSAISQVLLEGANGGMFNQYRKTITSMMEKAYLSGDKNQVQEAYRKSMSLIQRFQQTGMRTGTMDIGNASFEEIGNVSPMRFRQYWEAGLAELMDIVNNPFENKNTRYGANIFNMMTGGRFNIDSILSGIMLPLGYGKNGDFMNGNLDFKAGIPQFDAFAAKMKEFGIAYVDSVAARANILMNISNYLNNIPGMEGTMQRLTELANYLKYLSGLTPQQLFNMLGEHFSGTLNSALDEVTKPHFTREPQKPFYSPDANKIPMYKWGREPEKPQPFFKQVDQSGYQSSYRRGTAQPNQVVLNIGNLCRFDGNEFLTADESKMADQIVPKLVSAVSRAMDTAKSQMGPAVGGYGVAAG